MGQDCDINFPALIKASRLSLGESQEQFAKRFNTHANTVSRWESGVYQAPYPVLSFALATSGEPVWELCPLCKGTGRVHYTKLRGWAPNETKV